MLESSEKSLSPDVPHLTEIKFSALAKRWTVIILVGLLVAFLLHITEVLPPFVWAAVTAFIFNGPLKSLTARFKYPRWTWALGIYLIFFLVLTIALLLLIPALSKEAKTLAADAPNIRRSVDEYLDANQVINIGGVEVASDTVRNGINNILDRLPEIAQELGPRLFSGTARFLIDFLLYIITTFYLMLMGGRAITRFVQTLPLEYRPEIGRLVDRIDRVLGSYIKGQLFLIIIMSTAASITLFIFGVRYSLLLGIMTGVLELIPFVGPYIAITICSAVAFFQPEGRFGLMGLTLAGIVVVLLFVLRQLEDYVVIPNIIGRLLELPPLLVIFATISAAAILGPMGLLLGVPIVAVIKIIVGYLFYKLVDADRVKMPIAAQVSFEELYQSLSQEPPKTRLLLIPDPAAPYLHDHTALAKLKQLGEQKLLDLAFYCGEDEKTSESIREAGFPLISMEQEHFISNTGH